jgi:hypothetical protein
VKPPRVIAAALLLVGMALAATACVPVNQPPPPTFTPTPYVYNRNFPDPEVVSPDATNGLTEFRGFSTNSFYSTLDWPRVPTARSATMTQDSWGRGAPGDALPDPVPASWELPNPRTKWWAPAVHHLGGRWVMYYTAPSALTPDQCIGVATSSTIDGPFIPLGSGPFVCDVGYGGSIDPSVFVDGDGTPYLLWKNDGNCCNLPTYLYAAQLAPDGLSLVGVAHALITVDQAWEDGSSGGKEPWKRLVEGPTMIAANGSYWLLYSANWWDSSKYAIGYAKCTSPLGTCAKPSSAPLVGTGAFGAGPGGPELFVDGSGQAWLAYHAWTPCCVGSTGAGWRSLYVSRISFDSGTPMVGAAP